MKNILLVFTLLSLNLYARIPDTKQLIVVTTENWSASEGVLQRYEKKEGKWYKVGTHINIKLGRNGLGWGPRLHTIPEHARIIKKEGDGKAPAGIFTLKQAFGYQPFRVKYPYKVYKETDHCVDDVHSRYYNRIVDSTKIKGDYRSKEHMKFPKNFYKYGIVVNHNHIDEKGAIPGAGSCIFLHIKKVPTAGCTVMNEEEMKAVIRWLDPDKDPLLVQGTRELTPLLLKEFGF